MTARPDTALRTVLQETGWTHRQFARQVNRLAAETGTPTRYQGPSVTQWLNGALPKPAVRPVVLEVLSRRLHRSVTGTEVGFPTAANAPADPPPTVEGLMDLSRQDMDPSRRSVLSAGLFSVALTVPGWQDVVGRISAVAADPGARVGAGEVDTVVRMTARLSDVDDDFGGRSTRPMAAAFLVNTVAPFLRAGASEETSRAMRTAAAFLCYLTGWMAVDEGLHGLAQKYYVKALELAGASGDHMTYCHVLRGMSVQAVDLGHGRLAADYAGAAADSSPDATPRMKAFYSGQQAHAYAVAGERAHALASLRDTEKAVQRADSPAGTFGGYSAATLAYTASQVRFALGDVKGSIDSMHEHFRLRDDTDSQRSALRFGSVLAERQLQIGHLEAACRTWNGVLDGYPGMNSGRVDDHVRSIPSLLRPFAGNASAREVIDRARAAIRAKRPLGRTPPGRA